MPNCWRDRVQVNNVGEMLNFCITGTRYKRRGVDEDGHVANYVETEQVTQIQTYSKNYPMQQVAP